MIVYINGLKTYYEAIGKGLPIILLHGWGADVNVMRPIIHMLQEYKQARTFALDLPGFGLSDSPEDSWDVSRYALFVTNFLDAMNIGSADILGHSFGGRIAIKMAAVYPQRVERLILVDSAGIRPKRTVKYYLKVGAVKVFRLLMNTLPYKERCRERFSRWILSFGSRDYQTAGHLRQTFVKVVNEDLRPCLPLIQSKTLIIWGALDKETPLQDALIIKKLIPNSRLEVIPDSGHFPFVERPNEFKKALFNFLEETYT